ncbi:hypothetical protein SDC9_179944 [bioreactor metagenome]|uniref:Uncharacterized protein n=1 Tax=bioreactor metagenome TaxID=1076179 RepID=A0A645H1W1_9ZZZZ
MRGDVGGLGLDGDLGALGVDQDFTLGLTGDDHRDLHGDALATEDHQQVDMLEVVGHRVTLHLLRQRQLLGAVGQLNAQQRVGLAQSQHRLVARQGDVLRLATIDIHDGGNLVRTANPAGGALAELLAGFRIQLDHLDHV